MRQWPTQLRLLLSPPMYERTCPHGIGHPDPDSAAWAERAVKNNPGLYQNDTSDGRYVWTHGCDGCCSQRCPCGQPGDYLRDPFLWEIEGMEEWDYFCPGCYETRADDI
jgi:hypothetical protein